MTNDPAPATTPAPAPSTPAPAPVAPTPAPSTPAPLPPANPSLMGTSQKGATFPPVRGPIIEKRG